MVIPRESIGAISNGTPFVDFLEQLVPAKLAMFGANEMPKIIVLPSFDEDILQVRYRGD